MPADDREVYQHFNAQAHNPPEVMALAYAGFAKAKYDWMTHVEARSGQLPSSQEVDRWIAELPASRLDEIRQSALDLFDLAARKYLAPAMLSAAEAARDDEILREIRASNEAVGARVQAATTFRSTVWTNLFIGIVASTVFSLLVIGASVIFARDPSPFALYRSLQPSAAARGP